MSWDNPVSPIDAKNSIGFFLQFFGGWPELLGDRDEILWQSYHHSAVTYAATQHQGGLF